MSKSPLGNGGQQDAVTTLLSADPNPPLPMTHRRILLWLSDWQEWQVEEISSATKCPKGGTLASKYESLVQDLVVENGRKKGVIKEKEKWKDKDMKAVVSVNADTGGMKDMGGRRQEVSEVRSGR
ncbi:hypothetical protein HHI36_023213 [Cryptolaemus montrouzieri]|uniref:Uncharacterized protein n=1 Tax=Cryptolaemus montrouzieri TaxID=559131 RepID=A0ABD2PFT2_9CUCU